MIKIIFEGKKNTINEKHYHEVAIFKPVRSWDGNTIKIDRTKKGYTVSDIVWEIISLKLKEKYGIGNVHEYGDGRIEIYETLTLESKNEANK